MIIPLGTDAPVYHRPVATIALIAVCVIASIAFPVSAYHDWTLVVGERVHPLQWVTNLFLHRGWVGLVGNMIFLWTFGLVVEGKVGWWKFLLTFLGLGVFESAAMQILVPRVDPFSITGCSGVIFGLLAMCMVWAPRNEVVCVVWIRLTPMVIDISILWFAVMYLALDILGASLSGMIMANVTQRPMAAILAMVLNQSVGAVLGFVLAVVMLKKKLVDCEHWDLFAVLEGRAGKSKARANKERGKRSFVSPESQERDRKPRKNKPKAAANPKEVTSIEDPAAVATRAVRQHLELGEAEAALAVYQHFRRKLGDWRLPERDWLDLIQVALDRQAWNESVLVARDYLERADNSAPRVRLKLAQVLIQHLDKPIQAIKVLAPIPPGSLPPKLEATRIKLLDKAEYLREEGVLELEDELW